MNNGLAHISARIKKRYSSLAEEIRHLLLDAFIEGDLLPGTRVNDIELADRLGVSRTPVREALRVLQSMGIIETLPARITRVATLSHEEFEHAKTVWASLSKVLLEDVIHTMSDDKLADMRALADELTPPATHRFSPASFRLFETLTASTSNVLLRQSIYSAACRMRLWHQPYEPHEAVNPTVAQAHDLIAAISERDLSSAIGAFERIVDGRNTDAYELATA